MATFPLLSSGSMKVSTALSTQAFAMYPSTLTFDYVTRVIQFLGDQEQRFLVRHELFNAELQYSNVNGYDMSLVVDFFKFMLGKAVDTDLSHTFDITIDGNNYAYCVFDQDDLMPDVGRGETYDFVLKIRQLRKN